MKKKTALKASWVIPIEPSGLVLNDHAVILNGEKIEQILPSEELKNLKHELEIHDLSGHALIPGLINAHTHAAMSLFRGIADDKPLEDWLEQYVWPAENQFVSSSFVRDGAKLAIAEMLLSGTTCFNDMYFFADETIAAAIEAGIRIHSGMIIIGFPTSWASEESDYFRKAQLTHDNFRSHPLVTTCYAPHAPYTVNDSSLRKIATLAEELDVQVHMHLHETKSEINKSVVEHGVRPLERLTKLGLLSHRLMAVHMTQLKQHEIDSLAKNKISVIHCPESNLKLASGFCPITDLLKSGVNIALGTDGAASNNDHDLFSEMRTAALLAKGLSNDPEAIKATEVLEMATLGGARALDTDDNLGSIIPGKLADIVAVDLNRPNTQPVYDPISQIVYCCRSDQVSSVWVNGKQVVKNRKLSYIDAETSIAEAEIWKEKIVNFFQKST